ncbi:MAG TPA: helix-turn-helix domain-containing protein, partial [Rubrobacter sp.]|nr:helix-turn-helix domain-containing protein [Rubrobacter sp.]
MDSIEAVSAGSKSGVGVLDKSVSILAFLAEGGPASLAEVVEGTGLPRPTAHRLLSGLETHHLVSRQDGRYVLGLRLLGWGNRAVG